MIILGTTPIVFKRFYNALDDYVGVLSRNWHHNFDVYLHKKENMISITWGVSDFQITKVTNPNDNIMVQNVYDSKGRVIEQTMPEGNKVT